MKQEIEYPSDLYAPGAIDDLIAWHNAHFGDARMEAEGDDLEDETDTGTDEGDESTDDGDDESSDEDEKDEKDEEDKGTKDWPESARTEVKKVRAEAAKWRTKYRELQTTLKDAKTPEQVEEAVREYVEKIGTLESSLMRSKVGRKFDLPDEVAELLKGDTEEEMAKHAKTLQKFVGVKETPLKGGLNPNDDDDDDGEMDPRKLARMTPRASF